MTHCVNRFAGIIQAIKERQREDGVHQSVIEQSAPDDTGVNFDIDVPDEPVPDEAAPAPDTAPDLGLDKPSATGKPAASQEYDPINGIFPDEGEAPAEEGEEGEEAEAELDEPPDMLAETLPPYLELLRKSSAKKDELLTHLTQLSPTSTAMKTFIDMNRSAISLLDETIILEAQKKIRKGKTPEEIITNVEEALAKTKEFKDAIQRISSLGADRGNAWRQLLCALTGGAIVPGSLGGELHIPIGSKKDGEVAIIRPQAYLSWGYMDLGAVNITMGSASEYLGPDEASRLATGSPGERRILRGRVIIEAMSDQLGGAPWFILVTNTGGDWYTLSLDSELFRESYDAGQIVVVEPDPESSGIVGVTPDGDWVAASPWSLALVDTETVFIDPGTDTRRFDAVEIGKLIDGRFILNGTQDDIAKLGADIDEHLWEGTPEELDELRHSIPAAREKIFGRR